MTASALTPQAANLFAVMATGSDFGVDEAVFAALSWLVDPSDDKILALLALNPEQARK